MWLILVNFAKNLTWKGWLIVAAVAALMAIFSTLTIGSIIDRFSDNQIVKENNQDRKLREKISEKRQETETQITESERQTNEVLAQLPDAKPSPRRIARVCNELRNRPNVELPAECRPTT